jgi:predicted nuclease of predicted toxin-antitoxin system
MTRPFVELYVDEDVDINVAAQMRSRGFVAITALEVGMLQADDADQLAYAVSRQRAILTHNRNDFLKLATEYGIQGKTHWGIIIARRRSPYEIARRLAVLFNAVTADELQNQVRHI